MSTIKNNILISSPEKPSNSNKTDVHLVCETGLGFSQRDKNVKIEEEKGKYY